MILGWFSCLITPSVEASLNNLVILFYSITSKFSNAFPFPQICSAGADAGLAIITGQEN